MPIVDEKKEKLENAIVKESGCCGGASAEAAKLEEKQGEACNTAKLEPQNEPKGKVQGSSCCG